ncbi:GNAT family N-acetyltransferase [Acidaminobacter sp. JC074]|uniref:GNAT family N-acetyltransferase n=1 Tax=Acidaminobacter sp. JC074 TaxID=2530199 RepID=UPI001F0DFACB|nr:GNAT family N-acetyltransferase [Acidaminobacter sp. JC074]
MNNIKEKNLCKISLNAYDEYVEALEMGSIVFEQVLGEGSGFLYVKKSDAGYGIRIAYEQTIDMEFKNSILNHVVSYIENEQEDVYFFICSDNHEIISKLYSKGFKMLYQSFNMSLSRTNVFTHNVDISLIPYSHDQANKYIDLLGKAFTPIRKELSLKPYNWYEKNKETAIRGFKESASNHTLLGYYLDQTLLGVLEVINNELELLAVDPKYQGNGYGEKLLKRAISVVFGDARYETMTLSALKGNSKAQALYAKHGFEVVANQTLLVKKANISKSHL